MLKFKRTVAIISAISFAVIMLAQSAMAGSVGTSVTNANYVVFAWNDLGMHCLNPRYDKAVILPPYNTLIVQVVKRGDPPTVVTSGITVSYSIVNNTYTSGKGLFGQFWTYMQKLFGVTLPVNYGLNLVDPNIHNTLKGNMVVHGTQFEADGIPVSPINDSKVWNPYQVAVITVKNSSTGKVLAQTQTTIPTSDEINCAKCHGTTDPLGDILAKHDALQGTHLVSSAPVLCSSCHADPVLHTVNSGGSTEYLSAAIHKFHSDKGATCYDCHPGAKTQCSRSLAHTTTDGGCTICHGDMMNVANSIMTGGRMPWLNEPKCVTCHSGVAEVDTGTALYRNSFGHGGLHCSACHYSPHAMVPSRQASDNYQSNQYQGAVKTIGSCGACHSSSQGAGLSDYLEQHGYLNPQTPNGCNICHTQITTTNTSKWPHQFQWKNSNGNTGIAGTSGGSTGGGTGGTTGGGTGTITNTIGASLYNSDCSGCHGPLATSTKLGADPTTIQNAINGGVSAMGTTTLKSLTTLQIEQISQALGGYTATITGTTTTTSGGTTSGGTTSTDGATLYNTYCVGCHGQLSTSTVSGATSTMIQNAINSVSAMSSLSFLTSTQIQAISTALGGSTSTGTTSGTTTTIDN